LKAPRFLLGTVPKQLPQSGPPFLACFALLLSAQLLLLKIWYNESIKKSLENSEQIV
jgi:hypothetical protein